MNFDYVRWSCSSFTGFQGDFLNFQKPAFSSFRVFASVSEPTGCLLNQLHFPRIPV